MNNENASDVSTDKIADNAVIAGRGRKIKRVSRFFGLLLIL